MSKAQAFRDQSIDDLEANYLDLQKKLFELVNERKQSSQFEKPHRIRQVKKEIARLLTVISEKRSNNSQSLD
jgi:large subunit ribosomal protein L29